MDTNCKLIETNVQELADQVSEVETLQQGLRGSLERLQRNEDEQKDFKLRNSVLKWISVDDYVSKHHDVLSKRQEGTGKWFLESGEYKAWYGHSGPQRLFRTGVPGAGKTMLTSTILNDLQIRYQKDASFAVAYIYCDYRIRDEQTVQPMLSCLLKQLAERQDSLPEIISMLYRANDNGSRPP